MTRHALSRPAALALVIALALAPGQSEAIAPVLLMMVKQIVQDAAKSMLKDMLLSGLSDLGCKGIALANALQAFDLRRGGGAGGLLGMAGGSMPALPTSMSIPPMPARMTLPGLPAGMSLPSGMTMPGLPGGAGAIAMTSGVSPVGVPMPESMASKLRELAGPGAAQVAGSSLGPDQTAMMAGVMQSLGRPLSPAETVATIDELAELGFLPKPVQAELKECMVVLPASIPALGMGMGMMKPIVPQLRRARNELRALSPAEQDEVAAVFVGEMKKLPANERATLLESLDTGFFPPRIVTAVKAAAKEK